jgi:hypothetical protein
MKTFMTNVTVLFISLLTALALCLAAGGCGKKDAAEATAEKARQDSLFALVRSAQERSASGVSRIVNQTAPAQGRKFTSFSDSAIQSAQKKTAAAPGTKPVSVAASSDTAGTLDSAIATNAKIIRVDSGSAEDKRLDSLMLIANTLSNKYQQMVMTHTHRNLAEAAHQNPAKNRRLLKAITESAPNRLAQNKKINEIRQQRLQSLQNQMQLQDQRRQQAGGVTGDSGK